VKKPGPCRGRVVVEERACDVRLQYDVRTVRCCAVLCSAVCCREGEGVRKGSRPRTGQDGDWSMENGNGADGADGEWYFSGETRPR
jgi:hypothetical protein